MTKPFNGLADVLDVLGYAGQDGLVQGQVGADGGAREYVWRDLREKVGLKAAYFQDGVPLVGFCAEGSRTALQGLRQRLWNYGRVPLLINVNSESVAAYNAFNITRGVDGVEDALESGGHQDVVAGLLRAFNRHEIESGGWSQTYAARFDRSDRVDRVLLRNLRVLRGAVPIEDASRRDALDAFVGAALTASYLADRGVLDVGHLDELAGSADLNEVLDSGRAGARRLFQGLADHFDGDVFGSVPPPSTNSTTFKSGPLRRCCAETTSLQGSSACGRTTSVSSPAS